MKPCRKNSSFSTMFRFLAPQLLSALFGWTMLSAPAARATEAEVQWGTGCLAAQKSQGESVCFLGTDAKLVVWVGSASCDQLRIEEDGRTLSAQTQSLQNGCQLQVIASSSNPQSILSVKDAQTGNTYRSLKLDRTKPDLLSWTLRIQARDDADLDQAAAELAAKIRLAQSAHELMDLHFASGYANYHTKKAKEATTNFRRAYEYAIRGGFYDFATESAGWLSQVLRHDNEYLEADEVLRNARGLLSAIAPGQLRPYMLLQWNEGILLDERDNLTAAIERYASVVSIARRMDDRKLLRRAVPVLGDTLVRSGRPQEAMAMLGGFEYLVDGASACDAALVLTNKAWLIINIVDMYAEPQAMLLFLNLGQENVSRLLARASDRMKECHSGKYFGNIYNAMSQIALLENRPTAALLWAEKTESVAGLFIQDRLEVLEVRARVESTQGRYDSALRYFDRLRQTLSASGNGTRLFSCKIALGRYEALSKQGRTDSRLLPEVEACTNQRTAGVAPGYVQMFERRLRAAKATLQTIAGNKSGCPTCGTIKTNRANTDGHGPYTPDLPDEGGSSGPLP